MSSPRSLPSWPKKGNHSPLRHSPLRHASNVSNTSSEDTAPEAEQTALPRPDTASSPTPNGYRRTSAGQKRTIRDTSPTKSSSDYHYDRNSKDSPASSRNRRPSLKALPQGANIMVPNVPNVTKQTSLRGGSTDTSFLSPRETLRSPSPSDTRPKQQPSMALSRSDSKRAPTYDSTSRNRGGASTDPQSQSNVLDSAEVQQLGKSTTGHLRTLSKFAESGDVEFGISSPQHQVVGLQGRRRLQRDMSQRGKKPSSTAGYGGRTWMDQQRQFLQAYEYLCHIGEAKEWIEDIIHKPIPPIVQLEEALRDGVTLAEVVEALRPEKKLRIFRNPRLQFRHSDNIAIFFKFLSEVDMPDLFRFELVDLYEKKNIPKVIYCIHALSWLLFRKGIVDFRIGNLVGQLEFEQHELETMQKGLDNAGISMPNFSGMSEKLGAGPVLEPEPEPEPVETEEERIERELSKTLPSILELQSQVRGALLRLQLGDTMQHLWTNEGFIVDLQSRVKGDFARQISAYRLSMKRFAINLQTISRGFIIRNGEQKKESFWRARENDIITLQSLVRRRAARVETQRVKTHLQNNRHGIRDLQAAARAALSRWKVGDQWTEAHDVEPVVLKLQSRIRGAQSRNQQKKHSATLRSTESNVLMLQSLLRASRLRAQHQELTQKVFQSSHSWQSLQSFARSHLTKAKISRMRSSLQSHQLQVTRLQSATRGFFVRRDRLRKAQQLRETVHSASLLQAQCRGYLHRCHIGDQLDEFEAHGDAIARLQGILKGVVVRNNFADLLESLDGEEDGIVDLQAAIRAKLVRWRFSEKKRYYNENMQKVIKVQSFVRGRQQGEAYKSLTSGQNPPVGTVKNFVHLLNDSDFDFEEELESEKLQKVLVQKKQQIEQTEQGIDELDAKIGLLAHTKIASDEIARMKKHNFVNPGSMMTRQTSVRDSFNLKALSKSSRAKLDRYQELFFILQTQPQYLARFFRRLRDKGPTDQDQRRIESLVLSTFAHAQKGREEYLLLKLIARSVKEEIDHSASLEDYIRGNFFYSRLFNGYTIRAPGSKDRQFLRKSLGSLITSWFLDNEQLDLESDPLQIHRAVINDEELRTGRRSNQNLDVPREEAIKDTRVRGIFINHLQDMRSIVEDFICSFEEGASRMPYGTRYIASQMLSALRTKFPREDEDHLLHIVGNWLWRNYLKPAMSDPESYGIVDKGFEPKQRRNLADFLKVVNQIALGCLFGAENIYLQPLNTTVEEAIGRYTEFVSQVTSIPSIEQKFDISEFNDLYSKVVPKLFIRMSDVFEMHNKVAKELSFVCTSAEDGVLRGVIKDLGDPKTNETEIGGSDGEVTLTLASRFHAQHDPDAEIKTLFMETKRCVLYIIRVQAGTNLMDVMVKPVAAEDESRWEQLVHEEITESGHSRKRNAYTDGPSHSLVDIASLSYGELKRIALENILSLEKSGRLSRHNQYQDLLNEIAIDIRNKHRRRVQRQRELESVRKTLAHLDETQADREAKRKLYNETFEKNLATLQGKSANGGNSRFVMPFSKQWHHMREMERLGREPEYGSYKRAAEHFHNKGILLGWEGRDLRNDDITISSDKINQFLIEGSSGSMMITGASAQFSWDDLLEAEYDGRNTIEFFGTGNGGGMRAVEERSRKRGARNGVLVMDRAAFKAWMSKKFFQGHGSGSLGQVQTSNR